MRKFFFLLSVIALLFGCDATKKYMQQGNDLFAMGNYPDAANYYYNVLLLKPNNLEAKQALTKAGNIVLTGKVSAFGKYVTQNDAENAVAQYRGAQKYYNTVKSVGVELDFPTMYNEVYEDIKNEYINKLYATGIALMAQNKYDIAEKTFNKIAEVDSNFKDVTVLRTTSILEPMYLRGKQMLEAENFKEAFKNFDKIVNYDETYKNAKQLRTTALQKASSGVGVFMVGSNSQNIQNAQQLYEYIMAAMVKSKNPFLKIVDRANLEQFLKEQELGLSGIIATETAAKVGKLAGLKYVLATNISELVIEDISPKTDSVDAYEAFTESVPNGNTGTYNYVTRFKKVKYADMYHKKSVFAKLFYQLVSTETSQVVSSDVIEAYHVDEQHVFTYSGSPKNLYPQLPAGNFLPEPNKEWRTNFGNIKRNLVNIDDLRRASLKDLSAKLTTDISIYIEQ